MTNKRIEYKGKHVRVSRTGGVAVRASRYSRKTGTGVSVNTSHGLRLHKRLWKGTRVALQNGNAQFMGRWKFGRLNVNMSKSGFSGSVSNAFGSYNFIKPRYSSFKLAGIQVRGKNAATLQAVVMVGIALVNIVKFGAMFAVWLAWLVVTVSLWMVDVGRGIVEAVWGSRGDESTDAASSASASVSGGESAASGAGSSPNDFDNESA